MDLSLFSKFANIEIKQGDGTLPFTNHKFQKSSKLKICEYCSHKLYPNLDKSIWRCKSKNCGFRLQNRKAYFVTGEKIKEAEGWK